MRNPRPCEFCRCPRSWHGRSSGHLYRRTERTEPLRAPGHRRIMAFRRWLADSGSSPAPNNGPDQERLRSHLAANPFGPHRPPVPVSARSLRDFIHEEAAVAGRLQSMEPNGYAGSERVAYYDGFLDGLDKVRERFGIEPSDHASD